MIRAIDLALLAFPFGVSLDYPVRQGAVPASRNLRDIYSVPDHASVVGWPPAGGTGQRKPAGLRFGLDKAEEDNKGGGYWVERRQLAPRSSHRS